MCFFGGGGRCDCYWWWSAVVVVVHTGFIDLAGNRGGLENKLYAELGIGNVCGLRLG